MTKIGKTALVVVDVQQGFLDESWGPTTNHPGCETNVERLLQRGPSATSPSWLSGTTAASRTRRYTPRIPATRSLRRSPVRLRTCW